MLLMADTLSVVFLHFYLLQYFPGTTTNLNETKPFSSPSSHSDYSSHFPTLADPEWVKMSLGQEIVMCSKLLCSWFIASFLTHLLPIA